jgi:hypothetical protein
MSSDGSSDGIVNLIKLTLALLVICALLVFGKCSQDHRASQCEERGGVLLKGTDGEACVRQDALIDTAEPYVCPCDQCDCGSLDELPKEATP